MSELKIPEAAWRAAEAGANEVWKDYTDIAPAYKTQEGAIRAAAPLIVAAELRRIVDELAAIPQHSTNCTTASDFISHIRTYAYSLDPQGVTK